MRHETILFIASLALPLMLGAAGILLCVSETRRVGGLLFWRIGRLGGSFYIARREG